MTCSATGCDREAVYKAKALCQKHYFRQWRNGTAALKRQPKDRRETEKGYQLIYRPLHPLARKNGYILEHRYVLHAKLGGEVSACDLCGDSLTWVTCAVDHIDNNPRNNDPSNLRPTCTTCNAQRGHGPAYMRPDTHKITYNGVTMTPAEWARQPGVNVAHNTIVNRKKRGASDEEALFGPKRTHNGKHSRKYLKARQP